MNESWILGANDNDWVGWGITVAYLGAAALCFICGRRSGSVLDALSDRERWLWWSVGTALLLLGINKQLDIQTPLRDLGRALAETDGWYQNRRAFQMWFVVAIAFMAVTALVLVGVGMRRSWRRHALLFAGTAILVGFVILRAATFHHVRDTVRWSSPIHGSRYIIEMAGIACVGLAALATLRRPSSPNAKENCDSPKQQRDMHKEKSHG